MKSGNHWLCHTINQHIGEVVSIIHPLRNATFSEVFMLSVCLHELPLWYCKIPLLSTDVWLLLITGWIVFFGHNLSSTLELYPLTYRLGLKMKDWWMELKQWKHWSIPISRNWSLFWTFKAVCFKRESYIFFATFLFKNNFKNKTDKTLLGTSRCFLFGTHGWRDLYIMSTVLTDMCKLHMLNACLTLVLF